MAEEEVFHYTLDAENGTAEGVHEHGYGTIEKIEECVRKHFPKAVIEDQDDNSTLIFENKAKSRSLKSAIGKVERMN